MTAPVPEPSVKVVCRNCQGGKLKDGFDFVWVADGEPLVCGECAGDGWIEETLWPGESARLLASALAGLVEEFEGFRVPGRYFPAFTDGMLFRRKADLRWWRDKLSALEGKT